MSAKFFVILILDLAYIRNKACLHKSLMLKIYSNIERFTSRFLTRRVCTCLLDVHKIVTKRDINLTHDM
jgi:hypothetical protein